MHSTNDHEWVRTYLASALDESGVSYLLQSQLPTGQPITIALEEGISSSRYQLLIVSQSTAADSHSELVTALASHEEASSGKWSLVPFVLDMPAFNQLRILIKMRTPIDAADDWESGLATLVGLFDKPLADPPPVPNNKYLGIAPYREEDTERFFGREQAAADLARLIANRSLTVVTGPSGIGKTSLVRAGVIPNLQRHDPDHRQWDWCVVEPGQDPTRDLATALDGNAAHPDTSVVGAVATRLGGEPGELLIFVDQLEALLISHATQTDAGFFEQLLELADLDRVHVALAVRDEFRDDLARLIGDRLQRNEYEVRPLDRAGLREAIVGPARESRVTVAATLVERLLTEAGDDPEILPFVQETMKALWPDVRRGYLPYYAYDRLMPVAGRDGTTGLYAALINHADNVRAGLTVDDGELARVLIRLVQFVDGRPNVRRQQTIQEVAAGPAQNVASTIALVHQLAGDDSRLLVLTATSSGPGKYAQEDSPTGTVTLAHDSLITSWPFLRDLADDSEHVRAEQLRRELERDAARSEGESRSYRWHGKRLFATRAWRRNHPDDVSPRVTTFLRSSWAWYVGPRLAFAAVVLVLVTVGGSFYQDRQATQDAKDVARGDGLIVTVAGAAIERFEVTNERYGACVDRGPCDRPGLTSDGSRFDDPDRTQLPVVAVTAFDADDFCRWIGRRLPTWNEWTDAATGGGTSDYPWGDQPPTPDLVNVFFVPEAATGDASDFDVESAIDRLVEVDDLTVDALASTAPWVPESERAAVVAAWPDLDVDERGDMLFDYLNVNPDPDDELDVLAVDTLPDGATSTEPAIHHLVGNAGEWTSTLASCDEVGGPCVWDGVSDVRLLTTSSFEGDANALLEPLAATVDGSRPDRGFRCSDELEDT